MTETNPFRCYVPQGATRLVLGSFPCFNGKDYGDFYYSGSGRNHFWPLLSEITGLPVSSLTEKKALCAKHGIALSDVAQVVRRKKNNCSDSNLEIVEYNQKGIHTCLAAGVTKIFFTGTFVQRHFKKIFPGLQTETMLLPSPSPAANRHIGGSETYKKLVSSGKVKNVYDYRLLAYRELLFPSL